MVRQSLHRAAAGGGGVEDKAGVAVAQVIGDAGDAGRGDAEHRQAKRGQVGAGFADGRADRADKRMCGVRQDHTAGAVQPGDVDEPLRVLPGTGRPGDQPACCPHRLFANPKGPYGDQFAALGGQDIFVVAYSENQEESFRFLEWFIKEGTQKRWAELGFHTAHAATLESEEFRNATPSDEAFFQTMFMVKDFWAVPEYAELPTAANTRLYPCIVGGESTAKEVLDALAVDWVGTFKKYGRVQQPDLSGIMGTFGRPPFS